ncbi:MAG TPA: efflux transporter outer membrane subunit, partial [Steroidobacteraceae bacterium]|nr:efflux transporter outer membrane subunit [Steroidobacteraceae bacterium]
MLPSTPRTPRLATTVTAVLLVCASCAVGPDFVRPSAPRVETYLPGTAPATTVVAEGRAQHFASETTVPGEWWTLFGAAALDRSVSEALAGNQTLAAASANLRQSEDALRAGYGVYFPSVSADLGASRQRATPARLGASGPSSIFNLFTLSGSVGYLLDVFGGARRQNEALGAEVDVQRNLARAAYVTLTANVVNASIARAAYRAQLIATRQLIEAATEQLGIAEAQAEAGTAPYTAVLSLRAQLAGLQASLAPLELHAQQADHLLSVLAGHPPTEWSPPDIPLETFALPQDLPTALPSSLVRQRPDVLEAEARLHVASAEVGVATAQLFPTLTVG